MYRWVDHTGEVELEIRAGDEATVYADAVAAMAELLGGDRDAGAPEAAERRDVAVEAADRPRLLAELLGELAFLAETDGFVPAALVDLDAGATRLTATVAGASGEAPQLVKAVTLHRLAFEEAGEGWRARVVLDV